MIAQAAKTVEHALGIGGGGGGAESEVGGADEEEAEKDIGRLRAENAKLRQQLEAQAQRMAKLERISQLQVIISLYQLKINNLLKTVEST